MDRQDVILRRRAQLLARPLEQVSTQQTIQVVEFSLADERYAFELEYVKKVLPMQEVVSLPGAPDFAAGITSYMGQIIAVFDLRALFNLPTAKADSSHKILVLHSGAIQLALIAERVHGVRELPLASLQEDLPTLTGVRARYLRGISPEQTIVMDALALLEDEELVVD